MAAPTFFTLLTTAGATLIAAALAAGTTVPIANMAVGDGGGAAVTPVVGMTTLTHEVWRHAPSSLAVDPANPNWINATLVIPMDQGGWTVREVGLFAADGTLLAIGNFPDTYKSLITEGVGRELTIRFVLELTSAAAVTLQVNPSTTFATIAGVQTGGYVYAAAAGTANALTAVLNPAPLVLVGGLAAAIKAAAANTGPVTLNLNGLGATPVRHADGSELAAGELPAGTILHVRYDGAVFQVSGISPVLAATKVGVQNGAYVYAADTGAVNAMAITLDPPPAAYAAGLSLTVKVAITNTAAPSLNVNGLGAKSVVYPDGAALGAGELQAGALLRLSYDGAKFQIASPTSNKGTKALTNVQSVTVAARTSVTGSGANTYTTVFTGSITKKSATSNLVAWLTTPIYNPNTGTPTSSILRLTIGGVSASGVHTTTQGSSVDGGQTALNAVLSGVAAGVLTWTLAAARRDATAWAEVYNPSTTDQAFFPSSTLTTLMFGEIEP